MTGTACASCHGVTQIYLRLTAPDRRAPEILQTLESIRLPAQLDRDCVSTHLGADAQDPDIVVYLEEWASAEGLERRVASPDFQGLLCLLDLSAEPPTLEFRDIASSRGLEYVASVRSAGDTNNAAARASGLSDSRPAH